MQGVILAAGRGSRLGALTLTRSKAMLPVLGRPLVRRVLDSLAPLPIDEWIIVAGPSDMELAGYFQREHPDIPVRLVYQPEPMGMAAALRCAAPLIGGDFALSACDNLSPEVDIQHMLARWQAAPRPARCWPCECRWMRLAGARVLLQGERVTCIVEKPAPGEAPGNVASLPLFLFTPALLEHLEAVRPSPRGEYELQDAIIGMITGGAEVDGILFSSRQTLTSPADLLALNLNLLASGMEEFPVLLMAAAHAWSRQSASNRGRIGSQ
jgi:glucose-1-phosphate thymidylyltransferase